VSLLLLGELVSYFFKLFKLLLSIHILLFSDKRRSIIREENERYTSGGYDILLGET